MNELFGSGQQRLSVSADGIWLRDTQPAGQFIINGEEIVLQAGQSIKIEKDTRVQYSNPFDEECEYVAICLPAFSIDLANRE